MKTKAILFKCLSCLLFLLTLVCPAAIGKIIYVDDDAPVSSVEDRNGGINDGTSWENAYTFLQDALVDANDSDKPVEIRVAQGTYRPDQGSGITLGDREATFQLVNGVKLIGGYVGFGTLDSDIRDIELYETILSGDLNGNDIEFNDPCDLLNESTRAENSFQVVTGSNTNETAILDGFIITAGNANGSYPLNCGSGMNILRGSPNLINCIFSKNSAVSLGGGVFNYASNPILINCNISKNSALKGGGMYNYDGSSPLLTNCTFSDNIVSYYPYGYGGGMRNKYSDPLLTNCTFSRNSAYNGGGMDNVASNPVLINCIFTWNSAGSGGGISNSFSNPILTNCTFIWNLSGYGGGGIENQLSDPTLSNCTFSGNLAVYGGGVYNGNSDATLTNCSFSDNKAEAAGGGIYNYPNNHITIINSTFTGNLAQDGEALGCNSKESKYPSNVEINNCIFWDSGNEIWNNDNSTITVNYSNIRGGWPSEGNIDEDPLFADPNNGDYHLKSQGGRWDPKTQSWVIDDVTSPCIDSGDPNSPVYHEPITNGGRINMGAFGGTSHASLSLWDVNMLNQASEPSPANGAVDVDLDTILSWLFDTNAVAHEVYFGTQELPQFVCKQYNTEFDPGVLEPKTQYYWRIDNIDNIDNMMNRITGNKWTFITGSGPAYARNPNPEDGDVNIEFGVILSWNPGVNAFTHNVYLGTDYENVYNATIENPLGVLVSVGQDSNSYYPGSLEFDQTYYWRIDGINDRKTVKTGNIWTFTTGSHPVQAYNPNPANEAFAVDVDSMISWSPGLNAVAHDVYFGESLNDVNEATRNNPLGVLVSQGQDPNFYDPELLLHRRYYWRIDEITSNGEITTGDIWEFDTIKGKGRACFTGETLVWIDEAAIPISETAAGQNIRYLNISRKVETVQEHEGTFTLYDITLESGNCITVAENHYFMTDSGQWLSLHQLKTGMKLKISKGSIGIKSITKKPEPYFGKVYNLKVKDSDQYLVGADAIIVRDY